MILGTFVENRAFGAIAATAVVLAAIYLLWSYQRMAMGGAPREHARHPDLSIRETVILAPVMALILLFGVYPKVLLDRINPTTTQVIQQVQQGAEAEDAAAATAEGGG